MTSQPSEASTGQRDEFLQKVSRHLAMLAVNAAAWKATPWEWQKKVLAADLRFSYRELGKLLFVDESGEPDMRPVVVVSWEQP